MSITYLIWITAAVCLFRFPHLSSTCKSLKKLKKIPFWQITLILMHAFWGLWWSCGFSSTVVLKTHICFFLEPNLPAVWKRCVLWSYVACLRHKSQLHHCHREVGTCWNWCAVLKKKIFNFYNNQAIKHGRACIATRISPWIIWSGQDQFDDRAPSR